MADSAFNEGPESPQTLDLQAVMDEVVEVIPREGETGEHMKRAANILRPVIDEIIKEMGLMQPEFGDGSMPINWKLANENNRILEFFPDQQRGEFPRRIIKFLGAVPPTQGVVDVQLAFGAALIAKGSIHTKFAG